MFQKTNISYTLWSTHIRRGGSRTAAISKMEHFVIIVNGWKLLTIITKSSILDVAAVVDPPLRTYVYQELKNMIPQKVLWRS